ncbi:putative Syntaxin [Quillaja saponaria]|uniref:Syntaxin n=1 Tax=Quillaja saponaria TaxID=32244 RepID=A0AAD7Q1C1_QUISA|nr:putative Syntaxin [Quillaja saponaria]
MVSTSLFRTNRSSYAPLSTEDPGPSRDEFTLGLPPVWVDDFEEVAANIQHAQNKMAELVKARAKALMPSFGDGKEDHFLVESLTQEVTDLLRMSEKRLKKLSASGSSEDSKVQKNVQTFRTSQWTSGESSQHYLKRLRQQKEGYDEVDLGMNLNGNTFGLQDDGFSDMSLNEPQITKLKKNEQYSEEREREIEQVTKSVNELAQIMKDISVLVIDQGTIVDRIDYNVQSVATSVEEGFKQLQKAERTQKKGGMVMCATVLVIMCFIMLVLLILKEIFL